MSILIKGMEMPNCYNCTLESICSRWAKHDVEWQKQNRDEDCPLVELPAKHGRLIDADALLKLIENPDDDGRFGYLDALDITCAPTIIEAEVSDE